MLLRLFISLISVGIVCAAVFLEQVLIYHDVVDVRSNAWDLLYEAWDLTGIDSAVVDGMVVVAVYTLPETLLLIALYQSLFLVAEQVGLARKQEVIQAYQG